MEIRSLTSKIDVLLQLKGQLKDKLDDREGAIRSLTETIDQLVSPTFSL